MSIEILGRCCVCSGIRGWTENALVYCNAQGCSVTVHQGCYGIVTVPSGPWYCRKCESQECSASVRCELCPSKDGALKPTNKSSWAHVVCALYIPEVRFGNVTTMEPIILQLGLIPDERFSKKCYLCQKQGNWFKSTIGVCIKCYKAGCELQFHVTCAQMLGLLCEEAGNFFGYCHHHYSKLKKICNDKTIPSDKFVVTDDNGSFDSSAEKGSEAGKLAASNKIKKAIIPGKPPGAKLKSHSPGPSLTMCASATQSQLPVAVFSAELEEEKNEFSTLKFGTTGSNSYQQNDDQKKKITTSNFAKAVDTQSYSVFSVDKNLPQDMKNTKKRKALKPTSNPTGGSAKVSLTVSESGSKITISTQREPTVSRVDHKKSSKTATNPVTANSGTGIVVSVPLAVTALSDGGKINQDTAATDAKLVTDRQPAKRARSISSEKSKKNRRRDQQKGGGQSPSGSNSKLTTESLHDHLKEFSPSSSLLDEKKSTPMKKQMSLPPPPKTEGHVPHMLGNQLNPSSEMAKRMICDSLNQEIEAHSSYAHEGSGVNIIGPQLLSRVIASVRTEKTNSSAPTAAFNSQSQTLDQLLERQWQHGNPFLMNQAQPFDIASLLSCLHQVKAENLELEKRVQQLIQRRNHLLTVNERLVPLTKPHQTQQSLNQSQIMPHVFMADHMSTRVEQHAGQSGISASTDYPMQQQQQQIIVPQTSPIIRHNPNTNNSQGGVVRASPMLNDQSPPT